MTTQAPEGIVVEERPRAVSAKDIADQIEKKSGVTITSRVMLVSWFPRRSALEVQQALLVAPVNEHAALYASLQPTVLRAGGPCPLGSQGLKFQRTIFEMFEDDGEIRVFTLGQDSPPALVRLSKTAPVYSVRDFTLPAFIDELANEWSTVEDGLSTGEKELSMVLAYAEEVGPLYSFADFLQDLRDGVHSEEVEESEEEEEEEDPPIPSNPSPTPPPPAAVG